MKILLRILSILCAFITASFAYTFIFLLMSETEDKGIVAIFNVIMLALFGFAAYKLWILASGKQKKQSKKTQPSTWLPEPHIQKDTRTPEERRMDALLRIDAITELPVEDAPGIILKPGEICHYSTSAHMVTTKNVVTGYKGGSVGASVKVAKGFYLRTGSSRGTPIREDVRTLHHGTLYMTNQRIIFVGEKGFDYQISKLTALTPMGYDGLTLQFGTKNYSLIMHEPYWIFKILELLQKQ